MAQQPQVFDPWQTASAYTDLLAVSAAPAAAWRERRNTRLAALLHAAARGSRFWRERITAAGVAAPPLELLQRIAPVRKRELMARFDDWVCDPALTLPALRAFVRDGTQRGGAFLGSYLVWESSGSSGEPAVFVQDARALAVADALEAARGPVSLEGGLPGLWPGAPRIALVGAIEGHFAAVLAFERARRLNPWLAASSRSFSFLQPIERLVDALTAFAPTALASYPSMAWVLAQEQAAGRLALSLRAVWTGGETLTPAVRRTLGERFGATVRDSYGASECFLIACECRCGRLHLNADWAILEPVDQNHEPVPDGEVGHTALLTNLANHVQPVIRYDLGDRVRIVPEPCACGSRLPAIEVQGRADDVLSFASADGRAVHLAPLALTTVLEEQAGVFDFQLRQRGRQTLRLELFGNGPGTDAPHDPSAARRAVAALRRLLRERGLGAVRVEAHDHAAPSARGRSGKRQRVVREAAVDVPPRRKLQSA